jgi:hypothetical protein
MREVADKVHGVGPGRCVRGGLGEAANFVGVGAGAELFVLKGSAGGWSMTEFAQGREASSCVAKFTVWSVAVTPPVDWLR